MRLVCKEKLGHGSDGAVWEVWETNVSSAVKALYREEAYRLELECYRRLRADNARFVGGFAIPFLEGWDDDLKVIQMTVVQPPYLLDFGKVYLDSPPSYLYDAQLMANAYAEWRERFGSQWADVACVIEILKKKYGIYYYDPRPSNIDTGVRDDDDDDDHLYPPEYYE